jgi:hypothetical protein
MTTSYTIPEFPHAGELYRLSLRIDFKAHVGHQCSAPDLEDDPSEVELLDVKVEDAVRLAGQYRFEMPDSALPDLTEAVNAAIESDDKLREAIEAVCLEAAADDYPDPD